MFAPIDKLTLNLKHGGKRRFSYETKASMSFIPMNRTSYGTQSRKERRLLCESMFILTDRRTLILKKGGKRTFSYETKESMSIIPVSITSLLCPIKKENKIIM